MCQPVDVVAKTTKHRTTKVATAKSLKSVFQSAIGKYPFEVNLFQNPKLKSRLIKLIGAQRFKFLVKNFDVQSPIEYSSWNYHSFACQAHNCGGVEFEISYNADKDCLAVRYMVDGRNQYFKEKPSVNAIWDY